MFMQRGRTTPRKQFLSAMWYDRLVGALRSSATLKIIRHRKCSNALSNAGSSFLVKKATGFNARSSIQHSSSPAKETKCSKIFQRQPDFRSPHRSRHEGPEARVDVWGDAAGTAPAVTSASRLGLRFI